MSDLKYCQGTNCHTYRTKDRIRGIKGSKYYQTRRRSSFYYLGGNACSMACERDWFEKFGEQAINHFGRLTEPKKVMCDQAWYKDYKYVYGMPYVHYLINDLLGERILITKQQYDDENITTPNNLSQ
jgi:hypothetical protein